MYGYRLEGDQLVIVPEEAAIVRRIFRTSLMASPALRPSGEFAAEGITTRDGCRWVDSNIKVVLSNITYTGQPAPAKNMWKTRLPKSEKRTVASCRSSMWRTPQLVIDKETFDYVQAEMARRKELGAFANKSLNITCFTSKLKCSRCGCSYVRNQRANQTKHTSTYDDTIVVWGCDAEKVAAAPARTFRSVCCEKPALLHWTLRTSTRIFSLSVLTPFRCWTVGFTSSFHDGTVSQIEWVSTAKKDCWTEEHKDRQRRWMKKYMANCTDGRFNEFTTRIRCEHCGSAFRRIRSPASQRTVARCIIGAARLPATALLPAFVRTGSRN